MDRRPLALLLASLAAMGACASAPSSLHPRSTVPAAARALPRAAPTALVGGMPAPRPTTIPGISVLPEEGLAMEIDHGVVLVGLDGRVAGRLPGWSVARAEWGPAPPVLSRGTRRYLLVPGAAQLRPLASQAIPLAAGAALVRGRTGGGRWFTTVQRDGRVLWRAQDDAVVRVSTGGELVSEQAMDGDYRPAWSRAFDVSTGSERTLPPECSADGRMGQDLLLLCDRPSGASDHPSVERLAPDGSRRVLVGGPSPAPPAGLLGHWDWVQGSPDGSRLLLQWSGECESPNAFVAPAGGGAPRPVTGQAGWLDAPESTALGWSARGEAIVVLPKGACGAGAERPGVYAFDRGGHARLIHPIEGTVDVGLWTKTGAA